MRTLAILIILASTATAGDPEPTPAQMIEVQRYVEDEIAKLDKEINKYTVAKNEAIRSGDREKEAEIDDWLRILKIRIADLKREKPPRLWERVWRIRKMQGFIWIPPAKGEKEGRWAPIG